MREVRVNPAALRGTAATLAEVQAPSAPTAATPASSHPVSAAAAAQINAVQANIAQLMNHAGLLAQRAAATYESVATRYDAIDTEGRHRIAKAQAAYFTAQGRQNPLPPLPRRQYPRTRQSRSASPTHLTRSRPRRWSTPRPPSSAPVTTGHR